ncbi:MaoC family dehydratase [Oceanobacillus damuensis]|uniref:MaoC family dehydratase n=1 Tax=Oceanobacillus damuensis TaxID=937928 RepID=UPI00082E90A8|nr:MaoC family dehydratase [Oceanobacillus damuensis]
MLFEKIGEKVASLDNIHIPEKFGPIKRLVDEHKVKTYAFTQDYYHSWTFGKSPFGRRTAQAGILLNDLAALYYLNYDPNTNRGLHTEEEIWFHNPVFVNEEVTLSAEYVEKYNKNNKGYVVMEAEAKGEDGRKIITRRGTEIFGDETGLESKGAKKEKKNAIDKKNIVTGEYDKSLEPIEKANGEIRIGRSLFPVKKQITPEQAAVYSFVGDYLENIHNNLNYARKSDLDFPIVQALQQVGYLIEMLVDFFECNWFSTGWMKVKFIRPVRTDESVLVRGVIKDIINNGDTKTIKLEVWTENNKGELTTVGWASAKI